MAKKNNPYFDDFISMIEFSCQAAEHLQTSLKNFKPETLSEKREIMHRIENAEDEVKHKMMNRLMKEFVPPIDREDIIHMANELDNITDKIEDILIRLYMYQIQQIRPEALVFADVILRCCKVLQQAIAELPNFKKSALLKDKIISINTIEEEGDEIYIRAVRELYENGENPIEISVWSKLFDLMEDCCDTCEHVANVMESVIMKNS